MRKSGSHICLNALGIDGGECLFHGSVGDLVCSE